MLFISPPPYTTLGSLLDVPLCALLPPGLARGHQKVGQGQEGHQDGLPSRAEGNTIQASQVGRSKEMMLRHLLLLLLLLLLLPLNMSMLHLLLRLSLYLLSLSLLLLVLPHFSCCCWCPCPCCCCCCFCSYCFCCRGSCCCPCPCCCCYRY